MTTSPHAPSGRFRYAVVAVVDPLGQTRALISSNDDLDSLLADERYTRRAGNACARVHQLRLKFDETFGPAVKAFRGGTNSRTVKARWTPLGDSVAACLLFGVRPVLRDSDCAGIYALLVSCAYMFVGALQAGTLLRGGMEISVATAGLHKGQVYGPALAEAHLLESCVAKHPRMLVGPRLVRSLEQIATGHSKPEASVAEACLEVLARDGDGNWMLDYLGKAMAARWRALGIDLKAQAQQAWKMIVQKERALSADELKRHGRKYQYLRWYFSESGVGNRGR